MTVTVVLAASRLNPRDPLLVEEWTYLSALALPRAIDVRLKVVPMRSE
jgi:DNA-binding transcriptional MocR family regulator